MQTATHRSRRPLLEARPETPAAPVTQRPGVHVRGVHRVRHPRGFLAGPLVAALSLFLAVPALADPGSAGAREKELTAHMVRVDRGKKNLEKASRLKVEALKLASLEKATLSLRRARTALRGQEGIAFEALAEEAETLLVRTYNLATRIHLGRGKLKQAKKTNALALALDSDGAKAKSLAEKILKEEAKLAPPPLRELLPIAVEVLPEGDTPPVETIVYVYYVPYERYDRCDSYIGLGYTTYGYRNRYGRRSYPTPYGIRYTRRGRNYTFRAHIGHGRHGARGFPTSSTLRSGRTYNFRAAGRGALAGTGRTPKMSFSAGNTFGVFQR